MARIKAAEDRKSVQIHVMITPIELDMLDTLRAQLGGIGRSEALRQALAALAAEKAGGAL